MRDSAEGGAAWILLRQGADLKSTPLTRVGATTGQGGRIFAQSRKRAGTGLSLGNQTAYLSFSFVAELETENTHGLC